jgi:hypothetical protein
MDRVQVYKHLSATLAEYGSMPFSELEAQVDVDHVARRVDVDGREFRIEVRIRSDPRSGALRVTATAFGPSVWMTERMEESLTVPAPKRGDDAGGT